MKIMLIHWFLLALATAKTEELVSEAIMKTILESCSKSDHSSSPTVIFGDFNKFIDKVSIIRIDDSLSFKYNGKYQPLSFRTANVVLMEDSLEKLESQLQLLKKTPLWDHMVPFFIVGKGTTTCENAENILATMSSMDILNSVYICAKSIKNTSALYTLNPITNYAPHPWKRIEDIEYLNVYRQNFDANTSCPHLIYDKTKILDGYLITVVSWRQSNEDRAFGKNYFEEYIMHLRIDSRALRTLIAALNATGWMDIEADESSMIRRCREGIVDIMLLAYPLHPLQAEGLFPHLRSDMIAIVKLGAEVSTLEKIRRLWSPSVLIAAAVALTILFLILMIKNGNFGLALLDITRFLSYTAIRTDTSYQSFRIYFTTMLIFIIISDGVFHGKIAAFLTTREKENRIKSIGELTQSGYQMYAHYGTSIFAGKNCPKCQFREVWMEDCIKFVLNGTNNVCALSKRHYEAEFINLPLDYVEEAFNTEFEQFKCRPNWPLHNRINNMMMHLVESGLINFWDSQNSDLLIAKRQAMEAEWASARYRPVMLPKLEFAFHLLAAGLSLSTFVFFLELLWAKLYNSWLSRYQTK